MTISVIIPVLHEGEVINATLSGLQAMPYPDSLEIIVVDGGKGADTLKAITVGGVKGIISETGRARQMNMGACEAYGDTFLFLHADTELPKNGFEVISSVMDRPDMVGGAFSLGIAARGIGFRLIERVASLRSRLTGVPYGDQAIFMRRDYFMDIGMYRDLPLMEDVDLMRRVKKVGGRIHVAPERVKTSARRWQKEGLVRCSARNRAMMALYILGVSPERLAQWYTR